MSRVLGIKVCVFKEIGDPVATRYGMPKGSGLLPAVYAGPRALDGRSPSAALAA